jgi:septal ring factor EnvC (AmiA/AmiB activator)
MKKDQLQALGLTDEQIESVLTANGKDVQREQKAAAELNKQIETLTAQAKELSDKVAGAAGADEKFKGEIAELKAAHEKALKDAKTGYDAEVARLARENETKSFIGGLNRKFVNDMTAAHFERLLNDAVADQKNAGKNRADLFAELSKGADGKERADIFAAEAPSVAFSIPASGNFGAGSPSEAERQSVFKLFGLQNVEGGSK